MMLFKMIASCAGTGYLKGGGTFAAILYTILWWFIRLSVICTPVQQVIIFLLFTALGVFVSNKLESSWGKDSSKIVIDEVAGMCCTLLFVPHQWQYALVGLLLFRFFDIVKPLFISKTEQLPGGWGVMTDDVVAGVYASLLLQLIVAVKVF